MKMRNLIAMTALSLLPLAAQAEQHMSCRLYGLDVAVDKVPGEVQVEIRNPPQANDIFNVGDFRGKLGNHERVTIVFAKDQCTELKGNLITCAGKPLRTTVIAYWTSSPEISVDMQRVNIQTREVRALSIFGGKEYQTIQVLIGGNTEGKVGGSTTMDLEKNCR
jgi:hypothetical protein